MSFERVVWGQREEESIVCESVDVPSEARAVEPVVGRRVVLGGVLALPLAACTPLDVYASLTQLPAVDALASSASASAVASAAVRQPAIRRRAEWATNRPALKRPVREDVPSLLVHHTQTPNTQRPGSTPSRLRGMYDFHTKEKGWPDLAYNFLVDPFGEIWEGRGGSLAGPVRGDATGGSQGFAQLCCFIGDHTATPPTAKAMTSMATLLAWLASRYRIDLAAGRRVTFTSRGSNRWARGTRVSTTPIAAHRDMSLTACPGDALYPLVRSRLLPQARVIVRKGS